MRLKSISLFLLATFTLVASHVFAAPPAENILLIYYADTTGQVCGNLSTQGAGDTYPQQLEAAFASALAPVASLVQTLLIHKGDKGISSELASQYPGKTLANWCQVYDLRFLNDCNNQNGNPTVTLPDDAITNGDMVLYRNYMAQGGNLFLQGEHHDLYDRNEGLLNFVNSVATSPVASAICTTYICPDVNSQIPSTITNFTTNYGFQNNYNNLAVPASIFGWYAGGIAAGDYGSGLPIVGITGLSTGSGAMMLAWEGGALNAPYSAGKLVASFETNGFATVALQTPYTFQLLQNVYTLLSGCQHYDVTKTVSSPSVCVGTPASFTICANNTGSISTLNDFSISDTLATCLTYNSSSSSVAPSATGNASVGSAGTLYWWTFSSIAPGGQACVTINFTPNSVSCP